MVADIIFHRCISMGVFGDNNTWKLRFDRVFNEGLDRISVSFILTELSLPALVVLFDYMLVPYFLGASAGRLSLYLGYDLSYMWQNLLLRYSYGLCFLLRLLYGLVEVISEYVQKKLYDIRDARYLLSRELVNRVD